MMIDIYTKFIFIVLCFIIALSSYWFCRSKKDWAYLSVAMGFTLVSDLFLLVVNNHAMGVLTFWFVQMAYILRVSEDLQKSKMKIMATIIGGMAAFIIFRSDILIVLAVVYALLFVQNVIAHVKYFSRGMPNRHMMLMGILLFALCDIHVLMFNLPGFLPGIPVQIGAWGGTWIWVFYAPSQLLLSASAVRWGRVNTA